ncbi:hypothetical protein CDD80_2423 [Ophiocordyceps camponoti-rufipedis]|uniref:Uncharacterized protein n=1 Tax=Ophiocordyceps camponoti-rufipedis TaxID=2004952 RepID=A0A2C5ZKE2_9HYPO|nr:hypothetical protein CDD80_2423 [Ophiocordyceps camponoti-rufipedis]
MPLQDPFGAAGLQGSPTFIEHLVFPPGPVTDIYYIRVNHARFFAHVKRAWEEQRQTVPQQLCVFKEQALGWVQVMEHLNFCIVFEYLQQRGRMIGSRDIRILATNESTDITIRIPEDHCPRGHIEMYQEASTITKAGISLLQSQCFMALTLT